MSRWNIYHKDGTKLTDVNGDEVVVHGLQYSDKWMGECFLTIDFKNNAPINFEIGDYIIYRGERFELNYEPGKDKKASLNTYGEGFVYDSVKFNSLQDELSRSEFLDVVLNDNELHYTALPKFSFYVETLDDLLDRIQANLDEQIGNGVWKVYSRSKERSLQRGCSDADWTNVYGEGTSNNVIESKSITVDGKTCWEALALASSEWDVNFIVRGRNVYVGTAGVLAKNIFKYGLGKGLSELIQNADSEQQIVTRLRAYGSEKNLPSHYYADLGTKYFSNITEIEHASRYLSVLLDMEYMDNFFTTPRVYDDGTGKEHTYGHVLKVTFDFETIITGYVYLEIGAKNVRLYSEVANEQKDNGDEPSRVNLDKFIAQVNSGNRKLYIVDGLNKKAVPSSMKEYAKNLPNNMSINRLMLPGFPHVSLNDYYNSLSKADKEYVNPTGKEHIFSTNPHRPYIDSVNIQQIGLRSASQYFDNDDKTNGIVEIYPTIEEMVVGGVRVDEIDEGVAPDDNGRFEDGQTVNKVDIYLNPSIDFDINDLKGSDFSIAMKDGMCGGKTFKVASSVKENGRWRLTIQRVKDDALELWFPYKDYPIRKGDHFVLTGITLPDSYVNAASLKLLKYAIAYIDKNDYTRYVYQPKVDEVFMARQNDQAAEDKTGTIKSLHDTLKAGDIMEFDDDDLHIGGKVTIDQLVIRENEGGIPTYEVTLRNDVEVGTMAKIKQQISSLEAGNGKVSSETSKQITDSTINEASKHFLSKLKDDTAQGVITFLKGLVSEALVKLNGGAYFGKGGALIDEAGRAILESLQSIDYDNEAEQGFAVKKENGKYHAFITNLTIWGKAIFNQLEVRKLSYSGGNIYLSGAGSKLIKVVPVKQSVSNGVTTWVEMTKDDAESECAGWKCYLLADNGTTATMNYWQEGDQVRCQTMGEIAAGGAYSDVSNKSYWRTIPNGGVSTQNEKIYGTKTETYIDEDGNDQTRDVQVELYDGQAFAWIVIGKHGDLDGYDDEFSVGYDGLNPAPLETRDIPSAGDTIVLDGNRHRNKQGEYDKTDRQNVIILETTGEYAPRIACYANITEYKHTITKRVNDSDKEVSLSVFETSPKGGTKINSSRFEWISDDGSTINIINYRGDWDENNTYHKNDQVNHNNAVWVCVANSGVDVQEEPSDGATYWKKVLSGGKGEKGDDAVVYNLEASPGYIRLSSDGSIDYTNGYIDKGDEYWSDKYLVVRGYKVVKGVRDNRFSTEASPVTLRLTINDGSAYSEYTPSDHDSVSIDFEPKYDSYYSMLQEISHSGLNSVRVDLCEGSEYNPNKILATCDIPIIRNGKDGQKGDDGASYNINFVTHKDDVHNDTILYVYVVRSVGKESTSTLISNIPEISETAGLEVRVYCDGDYNENLTNHVKWSGSIQRSAWETVKNFEVRLYLDDKLVSSNSYSFGEQGESALEIIVNPETLAFDTNDYGVVPSETSKQASISCYRNGVKVTNVSYSISAEENCLASVSESNGSATVTISKITLQEVADDSGNSSTISNTSGYATIQVWDKDTNLYHRVQVKFMVNVAKFTGQMVNTNKQFSKTLTEVGNKVDNKMDSFDLNEFKAEITQTAREISLSVSEKSIGRRNLLVGSAFLREDNHYILSNDTRIEMNSGYQGTNCIHIIDDTDGTPHYPGLFWDGSQGGKSIEITKGKKYIISCWYMTNDVNGHLYLEALYTDKQTNAKRKGGPNYLSPSAFTVKKVNEWELFTAVIDTTDAQYNYLAFNFFESCNGNFGRINAWICRPMVEEGDTYNGWTLSQDDYDYIGGNMLDNTLSLDKSGSLYDVNGTLTPAGFGESTSIYKSFVYKLKGTVDRFSLLPSSGNVYNDTYYVRNDGTCYAYNGSEFVDVGNDYYYNILEWRKGKPGAFTPFGLEANKDYVFSFMAKGTGLLTAYFYNPETDVFIESSLGATNISVDGGAHFQLTNKWERYWVHWRPSDSLHKYVLLRLNRSLQSDKGDAPKTDCYIAQPKLEEGAVVTEYTERKSDLIDRATAKAAGMEITADGVELYGDKVKVKNNGATAAMFAHGKLNADLIDADTINVHHVWAKDSNNQNTLAHFGNYDIDEAKDEDGKQYPLWVGSSTASDSPFRVSKDGYMYADKGAFGVRYYEDEDSGTRKKFGRFEITGEGLSSGAVFKEDSMMLTDTRFQLIKAEGRSAIFIDTDQTLAIPGPGTYLSAKMRVDAIDTTDGYKSNVCYYAVAKNGVQNYALRGIGDVSVNGGVYGYKYTMINMTTKNVFLDNTGLLRGTTYNEVQKIDSLTLIVSSKKYLALALPTLSTIKQILFGSQYVDDKFCVRLTIVMDIGSESIAMRGRCTTKDGANVAQWNIKDLPLITNWNGGYWSDFDMAEGDAYDFLLTYDPNKSYTLGGFTQPYLARIINRLY